MFDLMARSTSTEHLLIIFGNPTYFLSTKKVLAM